MYDIEVMAEQWEEEQEVRAWLREEAERAELVRRYEEALAERARITRAV